jgi:hypothetical protein
MMWVGIGFAVVLGTAIAVLCICSMPGGGKPWDRE